MKQPSPHKTPKAAMKRSGVKELVEALRAAGVSADDIVIDRAPDGSVRVYKRYQETSVPSGKSTDWDNAPAFT